jgi:hypothetical protein
MPVTIRMFLRRRTVQAVLPGGASSCGGNWSAPPLGEPRLIRSGELVLVLLRGGAAEARVDQLAVRCSYPRRGRPGREAGQSCVVCLDAAGCRSWALEALAGPGRRATALIGGSPL